LAYHRIVPGSSRGTAIRSLLTAPPLRLVAALAVFLALAWPGRSEAQASPPPAAPGRAPLFVGLGSTDARLEVTLDTRLGFPDGFPRVGEGGNHGTRFRPADNPGRYVYDALHAFD